MVCLMLLSLGCANTSTTAMVLPVPAAVDGAEKNSKTTELKEVSESGKDAKEEDAKEESAKDSKDSESAEGASKTIGEEKKAIIIPKAQSMLGVMYRYGGNTPKGFDCSGFVQWVYKHMDIKLPRSAKDQARAGVAVKSKKDLQVGDIVTFRRKHVYHTGIYLGEGKFIHSPRTNKDIRISDMGVSYFSKYYTGTRRVAELGPEEIKAAEDLLKTHKEKLLASRSKR